MRPKIIVGALLAAVALLCVAVLITKTLRPSSTASLPTGGDKTAPSEEPPQRPTQPVVSIASAGTHASTTNTPGTEDPAHSLYVRQRIAQLDALAMKNDAASRDTILSELQNPDKEIRKGALAATIQFGDRSVNPRLREIAAQTEDPAEKAELLAAADYLDLPSLTEVLAERKALGLTNTFRMSTNAPARRPHGPPSQNSPVAQ